MAVRALVEPKPDAPRGHVQWFTPSYSLYPVLARQHGAGLGSAPLRPDFMLPSIAELDKSQDWSFDAALTLVTTPNAPSGRGYATGELDRLCRALKGVVIPDEAYPHFP